MENLKILIVEDESIIAMELEERLKDLGYDVPAILSSGEEAIQEMADAKPDLVLMDIMLKGEMDGIETAAIIDDQYGLPIIYLTANADPKTLQRAKLTGPYGYLIKPFEEESFKITIEMALYKHHMEQRLKERENWLNTTLKSIGEGVITTDKMDAITFMNRVAEEITGWREDEAKGKESSIIFNVSRKNSNRGDELGIPDLEENGSFPSSRDRFILISKDGREIPVEYSAAPIKDEVGKTLGKILVFKNISERIRAENQIRHLATHDALTDLPNLILFHDRLNHAIAKAKRRKGMIAMLYLDLDGFKQINDEYGHPNGDALLKLTGIRINNHVRESDTVARLGGDEFAIILENLGHPKNAETTAKKILDSMKTPIKFEGIEHIITSSIGISLYPIDGEDGEELLKNADVAMYTAKKLGKNKFRFFSAQN